MKYFAVLLLLATIVYADDEWTPKTLTDLIAARNTCVTNLNVPEDALAQFKKWKFEDNALTRSYITCIFKEFGLFCDHEGFHIDRLVSQFKSSDINTDIQSMVEKCAEKTDADSSTEVWIFTAFKCFTKEHLDLVKTKLTATAAN